MRVTVQYFARLRELAGRSEWVCVLPEGATAGDAWHAGILAHPEVAALSGSVSCAINAEFASMTTTVRDGDEIAFLPPVSGG
jgi:molybdopterin converting factor subunit 1